MDDSVSRSSRRQAGDLAGLLRLTACADLDELRELVDSQLEMQALTLVVQADGAGVELGTEVGGYELAWPVALGRFWRTVDLMEADLEHRAAAEQLPTWSGHDDDEDVTDVLADFFQASLQDFVMHVGGGWRAQEPDHLLGLNESEYRWFGSGRPLQVLLGVGTDEVVVAEPVELGPGLAGPARVERGRAESVHLHKRQTLRRLSEQVRDTEAFLRAELHFCAGCRAVLQRGRPADFCRDCHARYFGTILD